MTQSEKKPLKSKVCCSCQRRKPIDSYWKNNQIKDGWDNKCKICKIQGKFCVKKEKIKEERRGRPSSSILPQLWNVRKKDWIETFDFLKRIGYDLSSDKTIHEQFCEKHNLEPRKRMYEKSIQYTPKDLGLS